MTGGSSACPGPPFYLTNDLQNRILDKIKQFIWSVLIT